MDYTDLQLDNKVKKIIDDSPALNVSRVSKLVGISHTGFNKAIEKGTMRVFDFLKLCAALEHSVLDFIPEYPTFDENGDLIFTVSEGGNSGKSNSDTSPKVIQLKNELIEKQDMIIQLMTKVSELEKENLQLKNDLASASSKS